MKVTVHDLVPATADVSAKQVEAYLARSGWTNPRTLLGRGAPAALRAYANEAHRLGFAGDYVVDVLELANDFEVYGETHGKGDPDGVPHRKDDPAIVAKMLKGGNS